MHGHDNQLLDFLSCLRGSERKLELLTVMFFFLSCLSGSEHEHEEQAALQAFLSCLRGSELRF